MMDMYTYETLKQSSLSIDPVDGHDHLYLYVTLRGSLSDKERHRIKLLQKTNWR